MRHKQGRTARAHRVLEAVAAPTDERRHVSVSIGSAIEAINDDQSWRIAVTIISTGQSANRLYYGADVLRRSVRLWEGANAFLDHPNAIDMTRSGGRSVRDLIGNYSDARFDGNGIVATLNILEGTHPGDTARDLIRTVLEARANNNPEPNVGISADMIVRKTPGRDGAFTVEEIMSVNSADIVVNPSAGGSFDRALEADDVATLDPPQTDTPPADQQADPAGGTPVQQAAPPALFPGAPSTDPTDAIDPLRSALAGEVLASRLARCRLPQDGQDIIRRQFHGRAFHPNDLDQSIEQMTRLLAAQVEPYVIKGAGATPGQVNVGRSTTERVHLAMERLFGLPIPDDATNIPRFRGLKDAYLQITGDFDFVGRENPNHYIVREANEVTTTVIADALSNVMNKMLVMDYQGQPKWWESIANTANIPDVKEQSRVAMNDFGSLSTVAEYGAYTNLAWGDRAETYTPTKKGNTVAVTLEAIINDDLSSVSKIPRKLAIAAAVTINEHIAALFTAGSGLGPSLSDGATVFKASRNNTGTAALSSAALQAATIAMQKQTNSAGKRIGIRPAFLLVPPDLSFMAQVILQSSLQPGTQNNDTNVLQGIMTPIIVPNWTNEKNWYVTAAPDVIESIEVGFLNGRMEPELLLQDQQANGQVFTHDAITWKIRWFYGYSWLDYRGAYGSVVA